MAAVGVRRRRRAHPRRQRLLSRDDRIQGRHRPSIPIRRRSKWSGVRPDERAAGQPPARRADRPDHRRVFPRSKARTCCSSSTTSSASRRPARKCRRCSAACRRRWVTSRRWPTEMGALQERITSTKKGSITSVQADLRAGRRLDRPGAGHDLRASGRDRGAVARSPRWASTRRSIRSTPPRAARSAGRRRGALRHRAPVQQVLQRYKSLQDIIAILGMDELSEEDKLPCGPRPQDRALPVAAVPRRRSVHRLAGQVRAAEGHHPRLQDDRRRRIRSSAGSRPSTWSAPSTTAAQRAKKEAEDALANRSDAVDVSEAQAKLAQALAQLQALERLRKNLKH
jgi:hypothetical protein